MRALACLAFLPSSFLLGFIGELSPAATHPVSTGLARTPFIFASALLALTSGLILFLLRYLNPERLLPYYERLSPLLWYLFIVGLQSVIFLTLLKNGFHPQEFSKRKPVYISALVAFCLLLFIFLFVAITKLGITADTAYWGEPGVAIIGWQFVLSILDRIRYFTLLFISLLLTKHLPYPIFLSPSFYLSHRLHPLAQRSRGRFAK